MASLSFSLPLLHVELDVSPVVSPIFLLEMNENLQSKRIPNCTFYPPQVVQVQKE